MSEISCPLKNSWKLRWRNARNPDCSRDPRPEDASVPFSALLSWIGILDSDTFASLDDAFCPTDYYMLNFRSVGAMHFPANATKFVQMFVTALIFDFPERRDCATVAFAVALFPGDSLRKCHDHDESSGWC
jgi:hypothetical protein